MTALAVEDRSFPRDQNGRLPQLDALRGLAIIAVLIEHWVGEVRNYIPIGAGTLGVSLFFTLSGFLITGVLLRDLSQREGHVLAAFYVRRFFRLVPAFYATLLISWILSIDEMRQSWGWHVTYLSNFYMANGGAETVFWSLAVEEQFYLFWPLILLLAPPKWWGGVALGMIACAPLLKMAFFVAGQNLSFYMLPWQFEYLGAGCFLALLCYRGGQPNRFGWISDGALNRFGLIACLCLGLAASDWYLNGIGLTRTLFMNLLCCVFFSWLILKTGKGWRGPLARIFDSRVLQYAGVISYGVYLVHNWMPDLVEAMLGSKPKVIAGPIVAIATVALCAMSWRFFERPLIMVGRQISNKLERRKCDGLGAGHASIHLDRS